jgi:plastocyanin
MGPWKNTKWRTTIVNSNLGQQLVKNARVQNLFVAVLAFACAFGAVSQAAAQKATSATIPATNKEMAHKPSQGNSPGSAQVVALDECDPVTFNAALGPDFCHNVALGAATTLSDLFAKAAAGTPDPGWDFEPDLVVIKKGDSLIVTDQGGEPHTFTEVEHFGGGFIPELNNGEETVPECAGGFANVDVAKTRILQGSQIQINGLSKGEHKFECCIHPWMRMKVEVK